MFIAFRERGKRERERNIDVRNIDWLPPIHALTGNRTPNIWVYRWHSPDKPPWSGPVCLCREPGHTATCNSWEIGSHWVAVHTVTCPLPGKKQKEILVEGELSPPHSVLKPLPVNTLLITSLMTGTSYLLIKLGNVKTTQMSINWRDIAV